MNPLLSFKKYVSGMLDLLIPHKVWLNFVTFTCFMVVCQDIVDNVGKDEILFFGPDEVTAEYMVEACKLAERRPSPSAPTAER